MSPAGVDTTQNAQQKVGSLPAPEFYKSKDPKASQILVDPLTRPAEGGAIALITWRVCYPIHYMCKKTVPDCRTEKYRNWYGFTFIISMLWISFYSYLMVNEFVHEIASHGDWIKKIETSRLTGLDDYNNRHHIRNSRYCDGFAIYNLTYFIFNSISTTGVNRSFYVFFFILIRFDFRSGRCINSRLTL